MAQNCMFAVRGAEYVTQCRSIVRNSESVSWSDIAQWCATVYYFNKNDIRSIQTSCREVIHGAENDTDVLLSDTAGFLFNR